MAKKEIRYGGRPRKTTKDSVETKSMYRCMDLVGDSPSTDNVVKLITAIMKATAMGHIPLPVVNALKDFTVILKDMQDSIILEDKLNEAKALLNVDLFSSGGLTAKRTLKIEEKYHGKATIDAVDREDVKRSLTGNNGGSPRPDTPIFLEMDNESD